MGSVMQGNNQGLYLEAALFVVAVAILNHSALRMATNRYGMVRYDGKV